MNHNFDYSQKVLIAVEYGDEPNPLLPTDLHHSIFQRVKISEVMEIFSKAVGPIVRMMIAKKFNRILNERMGYWEKEIPHNQTAFVHYFIGEKEKVEAYFKEVNVLNLPMTGVYHFEPQSSAYPEGFPQGNVPSSCYLGESGAYTDKSIFWFNFFPDQLYLFEKTFHVWTLFASSSLKEGGECNQLVSLDRDMLTTNNLDAFVQINLNRFHSFKGFFAAAKEAGQHSFTNDPDYKWYGMLLRMVGL